MTRPPFARRTARRPATSAQLWTTVCAALAAAAFASNLAAGWRADHRHVLAAGDRLPLQSRVHNGQPHEVLVPGTAVDLQVGRPVREMDASLVDLGADRDWSDTAPVRADDAARLVPVSWLARPVDNAAGQEVGEQEIGIRLVAGGRRIDLADGTGRELAAEATGTGTSTLVAVDAEVDDLAVEVTFDGVTQRLDVATGELDRGAAGGLAVRPRRVDVPCPDSRPCQLRTDAAWRPYARRATLTTGPLAPYAWDDELGWAGQGRHWTGVAVRPSPMSYVVDRDGTPRSVTGVAFLSLRLDGQEPERTEGLEGGETYSSARPGYAVFAVDDDATPRELSVARTLRLDGATMQTTVRVSGRYPLGRG
ncbi:hypothetical protein ACQBJO_16555 [Janibacter sp. G349]|uniref:hypothetical protein n=1 Tax=Janibacter sp. G349 TaxID=3405424 RepID=UPI003B8152AA